MWNLRDSCKQIRKAYEAWKVRGNFSLVQKKIFDTVKIPGEVAEN
jgi:hypothetical protein